MAGVEQGRIAEGQSNIPVMITKINPSQRGGLRSRRKSEERKDGLTTNGLSLRLGGDPEEKNDFYEKSGVWGLESELRCSFWSCMEEVQHLGCKLIFFLL